MTTVRDPERRAPLTVERARRAAEILHAISTGTHPHGDSPAARRLADVKLRELLEETGGELVRVESVDPTEELRALAALNEIDVEEAGR